MATQLPAQVSTNVMRRANVPPVTVDLTKVSQGALDNILKQGVKYFIDATLSHKAGKDVENPNFPAIVQEALDRFYAPEWVSRQRSEGGEDALTLEEKALLMAIEPKFAEVGATQRANKKVGRKAVTVLNLIDKHGAEDDSFEEAARKAVYAVGGDYLTKKHGTDPALLPEKLARSWKNIQEAAKAHLESLKLKAANGKGAAKADDEF